MATTVGNFSAIDDTEVDAESPITETLVTRLRDNSYWIDAGTRQTTQTSTTKVLTPDGSGGVSWVEIATIGGVDGTKGALTLSTSDQTITSATKGILRISYTQAYISSASPIGSNGDIIIDLSDDSFVGSSSYFDDAVDVANQGVFTGTLTGTYANVGYAYVVNLNVQMRRSGGNIQIKSSGVATPHPVISWVIL